MYEFSTVCNALCMYGIKRSFRKVSAKFKISKSILHKWHCQAQKNMLRQHYKIKKIEIRKSRRALGTLFVAVLSMHRF